MYFVFIANLDSNVKPIEQQQSLILSSHTTTMTNPKKIHRVDHITSIVSVLGRFDSRQEVLIPSLSTFVDVNWNDKGPIVVDWTLEDLWILSRQGYWWDETPVMAYSHCLAWMLDRLRVKNVVVNVSCGKGDYGPASPRTYDSINVVIAPTFVGQEGKGQWALIVIKKDEKSIVVTSSSGIEDTKSWDYSGHYKKIMCVTGWDSPNLDTPRWTQRTRMTTQNTWRVENVKLVCEGAECGPVMFKAFREQVALLVRHVHGELATHLTAAVEFEAGDERLAALHHMGVIIKEMIDQEDVALPDRPDSAITLGLFQLSADHFREVITNIN